LRHSASVCVTANFSAARDWRLHQGAAAATAAPAATLVRKKRLVVIANPPVSEKILPSDIQAVSCGFHEKRKSHSHLMGRLSGKWRGITLPLLQSFEADNLGSGMLSVAPAAGIARNIAGSRKNPPA
jgi:hypothetical protein